MAQSKVTNTPVTRQTPLNGASIPLTLNRHQIVPFEVEDFARAQANTELMDVYVEPAAIALVEQVEMDLWATAMSAGTTAPLGTPGTDLTSLTARRAMTALDVAKAPMNDRSLIFSPKDKGGILSDSALATYFAFSQPDSIKTGGFGELYGMNAYMSQLAPMGVTISVGTATAGSFSISVGGQTTAALAYNSTPVAVQAAVQGLSTVGVGNAYASGPAAGGVYSVVLTGAAAGQPITSQVVALLTGGGLTNAIAQKNLAIQKNALLFASRPFTAIPDGFGVMSAMAMDATSGLALRVSAQYDINAVGIGVNLDILYGTVALRPNQAQIIDA